MLKIVNLTLKDKVMLKEIMARILKGFLSLIPIIVIIAIFNYLFSLFEELLLFSLGFTKSIYISGVTFVVVAGVLYYIGYLIEKNREFILLELTERVIKKIPIIKSIYSIIKDMINIFSTKKGEYKGVVYIPVGKGKIMGFITRRDENKLTVFIPTTPNPTTGLLFFVDEADAEYLDIEVEDAITMLVSLGATK